MDKDLMIEALSALVEKKDKEIEEISEENEYYFELWTELVTAIGSNGGRAAIDAATESLSEKHKARLKPYLDDNFYA